MERIKINFVVIVKKALYISSIIFSLIGIFTSFITWEEVNVDINCRIAILVTAMVFSLIMSALYILFLKRVNTIWNCGTGKLQVCYGDIINGISRNKSHKKIVVIPVNTCFDTIVDDDITEVEKGLVSSKSIHGKWINSMLDKGYNLNEIDEKINHSIKTRRITPIMTYHESEKSRGKLDCYELGTIVPVLFHKGPVFFLIALSEFNDKNKGQCSQMTLIKCVENLVNYYDDNGQGFELFIPLMGTGLSRVGIDHRNSLEKMKAVFLLNKDKIKGTINIVIYNKDVDKVTIFD